MTDDPDTTLISDALKAQLLANGQVDGDHVPVLKLFSPVGAATWLITEMAEDGDILFGLCDLGMGCPELGSVSLAEIKAVKAPLGLAIERDLHFQGRAPISRWAELARWGGSIAAAEAMIASLPGEAAAPLNGVRIPPKP